MPLSILLTAPALLQSRYEIDVLLLPGFEDRFRDAFQENTQREDIEIEMTKSRTLSRSLVYCQYLRLL